MLYLILVSIMVFIAVSLSGLFAPPPPRGTVKPYVAERYQCCDSGNGANCHPGRIVTFNGQQYGLMKSDINLENIQDGAHLDPHPQGFIDNRPVFVNIMPGGQSYYPENELLKPGKLYKPGCQVPERRERINEYKRNFDWVVVAPPPGTDLIKNPRAEGCYQIPNDMLIYKCREDSANGTCDNGGLPVARDARFDVYIRISDIPGGTDINSKYPFLTNCFQRPLTTQGEKMIVFRPSPEGQSNLQLRTFKFVQPQTASPWVSPWCKPAIYLYPEKKTELNVSVFPKGKMLLTIPEYPKLGWDVVAEPNGDIYSAGKRFDYLYYEASIPDELIKVPKEGFVTSYENRSESMRMIINGLGLQGKEAEQFLEYWVPILPKSPYYFIGIVPVSNLDELSPVLITPRPDTFLRVTLYFKPLEHEIPVTEPELLPINRKGFTAVEWGGIVKRDPKHPFSCFM